MSISFDEWSMLPLLSSVHTDSGKIKKLTVEKRHCHNVINSIVYHNILTSCYKHERHSTIK